MSWLCNQVSLCPALQECGQPDPLYSPLSPVVVTERERVYNVVYKEVRQYHVKWAESVNKSSGECMDVQVTLP